MLAIAQADRRDRLHFVNHYVAAFTTSSYWYGGDTDDFRRFVRDTTSGAASRNDFALAYINHAAPFGGVGMSGSGGCHGKAGFDTFSYQRPIAQSDLPVDLAPAFVPPLSAERISGVTAATAAAAASAVARLEAPFFESERLK
ncbi:MAG TPA: hypothetical protein VHO04_08320 [Sphingopyxis sp.]|uniref:hypothetical protein n=1 Tax=Sphingopyxis sp. TaxID=1908224 RepID=UPI002E33A10E|nr:hypothetical protein [Sphingopyxis sp.]HEX2812673.1 hypothetical protein [Sphingopyxis sp.]